MYAFPLGVLLESFRAPIDEALDAAQSMRLKGIQVYASRGEMTPQALQGEKRREFLKRVKDRGLVISALCGDLGMGFADQEKNPALIEQSKRILDLAGDLETSVVTTHIGVVPENPSHERYKIMQEACYELSRYADAANAHFAIETGPETAQTLKGFLDALGSKGVAVNFDPANFVMVTGDDPVKAVHTLRDYIVHTHAKDGRRLKVKDPEIIYGLLEDELNAADAFIELPLGEGDVDFPGWMRALDEIGYRGFLTIEREVGESPQKDIETAVRFLRNQMK